MFESCFNCRALVEGRYCPTCGQKRFEPADRRFGHLLGEFAHSLTDLDGRVDRVVVSELKDNTFYAIIHLTVKGERVAVDARPSDAIALALRTHSPILVEETVIDNAKTVDFASERADTDRLQKWLESLDPDELGKYKM